MGVYNAEDTLRRAVDSILTQTFREFEFIIINDGSNDATAQILAEYSKADSRVRVIDQANQGLTRSLVTASEIARGTYLARQDADDISLPERLQMQADVLASDPDCVLVTSWVEDVSPEGVVCNLHQSLTHRVRINAQDEVELTGIAAHGSVMMRRDAFDRAGGYRACFYYAQDSDLWLRLSLLGRFLFVPCVLYRRVIGIGSISSRFRQAQTRFCELAQESYRAIRAGGSDAVIVADAELVAKECRRQEGQPTSSHEVATSLLLLAAQIMKSDRQLARKYLWKAIQTSPFHMRSWKALLWSMRTFLW
jgi:glycosyltransferase involved in cell wall biosynthesis